VWKIVDKGKEGRIASFLSYKEMDCRCKRDNCTLTIFYRPTIIAFESTRIDFGAPITATSGFRCQEHNKAVGGKDDSRHKRGMAIDMIADDLDKLERIARRHFDVVIRYKTFIHAHKKE
jgi:hypothetical protein